MRNPLQTVYIIVFVCLFLALRELPFFSESSRLLMSMLLGAVGALAGMYVFKAVEGKSSGVKYGALIFIAALAVMAFYFVNKNKKQQESDAAMRWADSIVNAKKPQ